MGIVTATMLGFLIDTHVLLWWFFNDPKVSRTAYKIIEDPENTILVSSASGWEIATKYRLGKLPYAGEAIERLPELIRRSRMTELPISLIHAIKAGSLPGPHKDPFDRMLTAQGQLEGVPIITSDAAFGDYDVVTIW